MGEEQKEAEMKISELQDKVTKLNVNIIGKDPSSFMQWNNDHILEWICSIENGRFVKYKQTLRISLYEAEIVGEDLLTINQLDIKGWGIKNYKDQKGLCEHIQRLVRKHVDPKDKQI